MNMSMQIVSLEPQYRPIKQLLLFFEYIRVRRNNTKRKITSKSNLLRAAYDEDQYTVTAEFPFRIAISGARINDSRLLEEAYSSRVAWK